MINNELEEIANTILVDNDMLKVPVNLSVIAENYGIDVYKNKLPKPISGAIRYNNNKAKFEILLNETESYVRQRFTLAHELAHFILESDHIETSQEIHFVPQFRLEQNPEEKDIEYLAGAILMEQETITKLFNSKISIKELAEIFKVSESAVTVRLRVLGLLWQV